MKEENNEKRVQNNDTYRYKPRLESKKVEYLRAENR